MDRPGAKLVGAGVVLACCLALPGCSAVSESESARPAATDVSGIPPELFTELRRSVCGDGDKVPVPGVAASYPGFENAVTPTGVAATTYSPK